MSLFVEDEDLVVSVEHLEDLCALLHTDSDILYFGIEVDLEAVFLRQLGHFLTSFILLQDAVFGGLSAEDDVVENGEALHEHEMLVDHSDTQGISVVGIVDLHLFAVLLDDAFFGLVHAEQHRHQRGLSCAVFPKQSFAMIPGNRFVMFSISIAYSDKMDSPFLSGAAAPATMNFVAIMCLA